jgi:sugar phosphate isomerase/epimerase
VELHPQLGAPVFRGVGEEAEPNPLLLQLPRQLADFGAGQMEICHFHLSRDPQFLRELRAAIDESDVKLLSVLVDAGDITGDDAARDEAWIASWLAVAQTLGAERLRVIAGKAAPTPDNLAQSRAALGRLADEADKFGVRITTENWFDLLQHPRDVLDC